MKSGEVRSGKVSLECLVPVIKAMGRGEGGGKGVVGVGVVMGRCGLKGFEGY